MSDKPKRPGWWTGVIVVALIVLLLGYPLSIGPAWIARGNERLDFETFEKVYAPLNWLMEHNGTTNDLVIWYSFLWIDGARSLGWLPSPPPDAP